VRLTQLLSLVLTDSASERVRRNHERAIKELQAEVRKLQSASAASGLWAPVGDPVVVGSTVSSFAAATSISLNDIEEALLKVQLNLATGTTHTPRLGLRGTFVDASNYSAVMARHVAAGVQQQADGSEGDLQFAITNAADRGSWSIYLSKRAGEPTFINGLGSTSTSAPTAQAYWVGGTDRATSDVTRIDIGSDVASRILAGSTAQLYRRVA
jgi:hypothetical protein